MKRSKHISRTALCLLLILTSLLTTAGCGKSHSPVSTAPHQTTVATIPAVPTTPAIPSTPSADTEEPAAFGTPILRFAVTSDVHIREASANMESYVRLEQFYKTAYAYSDAQTDYNKLDGIFFIGDLTNGGTPTQYTYFFDYVNTHTRTGTVARAVIGNHEFYATGYYTNTSLAQAPLKFLEYTGYEAVDSHQVIGGYHFIFLGMDLYSKNTNTYFSGEKQQWLIKELNAAVADDPNKPIFVFQHQPPKNTVVGSYGQNGDAGLKVILEKYPQVIDFSGHSHRPLSNPRSIWQGNFTALNTGSLAYLSTVFPDHKSYKDGGITATDKEGSWNTGDDASERNGGMYYIVEVDKNHTARVLIYNIFTESLWGEPYIIDSLNPADFRYTDGRKKSAETPVFAENAALTVASAGETATITIPQASCKDIVQCYRVEVYEGETLQGTYYALSCTYYGDATPSSVKAKIDKLTPGTAYTAKVYAVSSWAKESEPLKLDFTATN